MPFIHFDNTAYSYPKSGVPALAGVNLSISEGEIFAVMGKNGSGKTTLCKLINGIIPHHLGGRLTGAVTVGGILTDKSSVPELAQIAGLVLDDPDAQLINETVKNEAAFGPENLLIPPDEIEIRVQEALSLVGLAGFEQRKVTTLSGGEKQRLVIASFLSMKSKILVLDEPLCRLDPEGAEKVLSVLKDLRDKSGVTVIISSHNTMAMQRLADRVCILKEGRVAACDTADNIFANRQLLEENGIQPPEEHNINTVFTPENCINPQPSPFSLLPSPFYHPIVIKDFSFSYNKENPLIQNLNLTIFENDFAAIIGHNGCGKTTLLKNITGLLGPKQKFEVKGDIFIYGKNTKETAVSEISRAAGFVMQNPDNQLFTDSVYNEVSFGLINAGFPKDKIKESADNALNAVGLTDKEVFPHALSYADRSRLLIACVIAIGAKILIFDEINIGQDYSDCLNIMNIAHNLHLKGRTIIFTTHNMSLACRYANRLIKMEKDGTISTWKQRN